MTLTMSHLLMEEFWELLGPNGPFLCKLFHNQSQQLAQLQTANNALEDHALEAQSDITNAATKAASSVAQVILTNMPATMGSHSLRSAKADEVESFDRNRDKTEQFVQSIHIAVTMQLNTFEDKRMKICMHSPSCMGG